MKSCRFVVAAGIMTAALLQVRGTAVAADKTITVLGIEATDGAPEAVATALTDALRQHVAGEKGFKLVPGKDLVEIKLIFSCPDEAPSCMVEAARSLGASKMVFGGIKQAAGDSFVVTLKLLDSDRKQVDAWVAEQITRAQATPAAIRAPVQKWFATLTGQSALGMVRVRGNVPGTAVMLDGQPVGTIGSEDLLLRNIPVGRHEIVASKPGLPPVRKQVDVVAGGTAEVSVDMGPPVAQTPPASEGGEVASAAAPAPIGAEEPSHPIVKVSGRAEDSSRNTVKAATWATLVAGVAAFGAAIYFGLEVLSIDRELDDYRRFPCPPSVPSPQAVCDIRGMPASKLGTKEIEFVEKMQAEGKRMETLEYAFIGVGAAFTIASGVLFYKGYLAGDEDRVAQGAARGRPPRLRLLPVAHATGGGLLARFAF
jgi:hypothetical protein